MLMKLDPSSGLAKRIAGVILRFYIFVSNMIFFSPLGDDKMLDIDMTGPLSRFLCCRYMKCAFVVAIDNGW